VQHLAAHFHTFRPAARKRRGKPRERSFFIPMRRAYEVGFIVRLDGTDENLRNTTIDQVRGWIETNETGKVSKIDRWGERELQYEIDKQRKGFYVFMTAEIETSAVDELERNLKLSPYLLRHLVIRGDE
jgi:small subunit ribosomal protein S6